MLPLYKQCLLPLKTIPKELKIVVELIETLSSPGGGGVLPYITYIGMCRCEGYGFQAVWIGIGYRNQSVLV